MSKEQCNDSIDWRKELKNTLPEGTQIPNSQKAARKQVREQLVKPEAGRDHVIGLIFGFDTPAYQLHAVKKYAEYVERAEEIRKNIDIK
jgi:hypothetical protein